MKTYINKKTVIIFIVSILCILLLWLVGFGFGNEKKLSELLGITFLGSAVYLGTWFIYPMIVLIGFGIPFLVIRFIFHERAQDYGFSLGEAKSGIVWILALIPAYFFLPLLSANIGTSEYLTYVGNPKFVKPLHIAIHGVSYLGFAFGFEFLFRGFVLFGLNKAMGNTKASKWIAIAISGILSALCLIGLPWLFPLSALLLCVPGGLLNFRLRSFVYFAFFHWNLGIWTDIWEIIKIHVSNSVW
ncbi:MAG: hypothetical protein KAV87_54960 [Desulfobacteraceae bacterium]|nr:hypothetical protein [Desulfobacteraceae bacterium]